MKENPPLTIARNRVVLGPPKERSQRYFLLQANLLSRFDPISLFLILISLQKPSQIWKEKNPKPPVFVCSFFFLAFPSFPSPSLKLLRRPHGRETKSLSSCFGLFFITSSVCFLTPESRLKLLHSSSLTIPETQFLQFQQMCQRYSVLPRA